MLVWCSVLLSHVDSDEDTHRARHTLRELLKAPARPSTCIAALPAHIQHALFVACTARCTPVQLIARLEVYLDGDQVDQNRF